MKAFPSDFPANLTGFGGDRAMSQAQHRAALKRIPVVLVHGNGGHSVHPKWGMETMKSFLKEVGYRDCELWAMDHLGENNNSADLNDPHRHHIAAFRTFVDRVREYLGVRKVDFVAHSLGCGMVNAYLRGLQGDGRWDSEQHRIDAVGTFVALAGATYGLGPGSLSEFKSGSAFELASHKFQNVVDDTPRGADRKELQQAPVAGWKQLTPLDNSQVCYVALTSQGDFVDAQNADTGRRVGADLNERFSLGGGLDGHERIIKSRTVFDKFKPFLNRAQKTLIRIDKDSGSYASGLQVVAQAEPAAAVRYRAERVTKKVDGGFLVATVAQTFTGTLAPGESLTLSTDGVWEVVFSADGADDERRSYGVNVNLPQVTILTDNAQPFTTRTLEVLARTTGGTLYHGSDGEHWMPGANMVIDRTVTAWFVAVDGSGVASPVVKRAYTQVLYEDMQTATLTQHFIAQRLSVNDYVSMGLELGFNATVTLYRVGGQWVRDVAVVAPATPAHARAPAALQAAAAAPTLLSADKPSGEYAQGFEVTLSAGGGGLVYYTTDGSDPSDASNPARASFAGRKSFPVQGRGRHALLCCIEDAAGCRSFESFVWVIGERQHP